MKLLKLKLLMVPGALLMWMGCATIEPPQPPSLNLPKPPSDLRAARKGNRVTLTWTIPSVTTDRETVRSLGSTRICRSTAPELTQCGTPLAEIPPQPTSTSKRAAGQNIPESYTDSLPMDGDASAAIAYAVEALNAAGRSAGLSNQVRVSLVRTLPAPQNFGAQVTSQGVVLSWTGDSAPAGAPSVRYVYRVYRRQEGSQQQTLAGEVPAGLSGNFTLIDSNFEWEKTYEYHAETVTVIARDSKPELQVEGDDTPEVKVFADDVFAPAVPTGLQAVFSGPGQKAFVDLVWAPVTDVDLAGYNVYRHEEGAAAVKLNAEPLKTLAYRDENVVSGKSYLYSVSAVDIRGNESRPSEEASERVP